MQRCGELTRAVNLGFSTATNLQADAFGRDVILRVQAGRPGIVSLFTFFISLSLPARRISYGLSAKPNRFQTNRRSAMNCSSKLSAAAGTIVMLLALSAPAHAQATRTWVSGVGNDANPCSRTAPCKTFAGAISKTAASGEINCLDPGGFGAITITKSITLNCHEELGAILAAGGPGIIINALSTDKVILRNLQINGVVGTALPGTIGVRILSAGRVSIENCVITQFSQQGVLDARTSGSTKLSIVDSTISFNTAAGVSLTATGTSFTVMDNVRSLYNLNGVSVGNSNTVMVRRSLLSGNTGDGVSVGAGGLIQVNDSAITNNVNGFNSAGTSKVSNSDIIGNTTAFAGANISFGNNRLTGTLGVAPTAAGLQTHDLGQI
jgi:hypothetical protein